MCSWGGGDKARPGSPRPPLGYATARCPSILARDKVNGLVQSLIRGSQMASEIRTTLEG